MITPESIPQDVVDAYEKAWKKKRKEIGRGISQPGTKTRAGLAAAFTELGLDSVTMVLLSNYKR